MVIASFLVDAVFEWMVINLLLIYAVFSYLITRVAHFFHLEAPCAVCSRLSRLIVEVKPRFRLEKMCRDHKLHIFCHFHENIADRHKRGLESNEFAGESLMDRLRSQVDQDKKLLNELYMELEEERDASGVAINQALAMITKLQKEKSELRMEAFQCLRMMEEQAQYDNEALELANELIIEKEKEVKGLEEDLAVYRNLLVYHDYEALPNSQI